ncbi:4'-phosphopantetheinyl transferase NpgA [Arthroderma uncinatum]|uniref:4'-phosphopantetheinyl transferase NpgA n=1 Tax=Arthroderma uncinatum TaxID=74035 RepID=UPI00144AEB8D|nr:4'-phosphopantetheinyl transferase NpgA [Arthroderma uncinatum]KAF3480446.1 4'-phosphopantetheinyl transferase NpgA [Arthroderma uncinatum]
MASHILPVDDTSRQLTRWYIDMRNWTQTSTALPLIDTLQPSEQKKIRAFYHVVDQHMSLASSLLKYLYIHRTSRVPWNQIIISRTPQPHCRPCYIPLKDAQKDAGQVLQVEFNVSHQASMVALAGCMFSRDGSENDAQSKLDPSSRYGLDGPPQIGIDITCTDEREKRNPDSLPSTEAQFREFVDIFTEAFSPRELETIKSDPRGTGSYRDSPEDTYDERLAKSIKYRTRLFYTYWALKEAYIKMVGEGLLADWLQKLEFSNVVPPEPEAGLDWGSPKTGIEIRLKGEIVDNVRMEVVAFGERYILATATRGGGFGKTPNSTRWDDFRSINIEKDVGPCARGECDCLQSS